MNYKFKETIDNIINNSFCLRCYQKIDRFKYNYKYYKNLKDIYKIKPYYIYSNHLYLKHKPCNYVFNVTFTGEYLVSSLDIKYSFSLDKENIVQVYIDCERNLDNSFLFKNSISYKRKWYEIESTKPFCRKMVNKYINNLIFE